MIDNPCGTVIKTPERRCTACGSPEIAAVAPGDETIDMGDLFHDLRGQSLKAWCMACWVQRFAHEYRA